MAAEMHNYDFVYLTNTPSFYKLNLCEEIAKSNSLLLVLYGYGAEAVNTVIESRQWRFDYRFIHEGDANQRSKVKTFRSLLRLMRQVKARKVLFSGWLAPEYNFYAFLSSKSRNVCVCESSLLESSFSGIKGWIKKRVINRMSAALPSGLPHDQLFESIGFKGPRFITGGVGIINKLPKTPKEIYSPLRYLYVGRLVDVKNIGLLIEAFNQNGKPLTIVGDGPLRDHLQQQAKPNISFKGFIDNEKLGEVYQSADVFILPSYSEPWGLVVEEAIYWGLPVIVSDRVGCSIDMVKDLGTGEIFRSGSVEDLLQKINAMESNYSNYSNAVNNVDFYQRDRNQTQAYLNLLRE